MPPEDIIPVAGPPPAGVAVADAAALLAHNNQLTAELAAARARVVQVEQADKAAHKTAAIAEALAGAPLVGKGAAAQLTALLEKEITLTTDPSTGRQIPVGPGLVPAHQYIQGLLQNNPDYAHFLKANNPLGGTGAVGGQSHPTAPAVWGGTEPAPATLGEAIMQQAKAAPRQQPAPHGADLSKSFGLGPRR
jgi:hypothetical protein